MKVGDLVYIPDEYCAGLIVGWVKTGGPEDTIWEVLYDDGTIATIRSSDMQVVNESR